MILCVLLCIVVALSAFYISEHIGHVCTGDSCQVCFNINIFQSFLRTFNYFILFVFLFFVVGYAFIKLVFYLSIYIVFLTPITLYVKLSN